MKKLALVLVLMASSLLTAQVTPVGPQPGPPYMAGLLYASNFGQWQVPKGNLGTYSWNSPNFCRISSTPTMVFNAFTVGVPVKIVDTDNAANSETVTPTAVTVSSAACGISIAPTRAHNHFFFQSASGGLYESIAWALGTGAVYDVEVTPDFTLLGGLTSTITSAPFGSTSVSLSDHRTATVGIYTWNGSAYVATGGGGGAVSSVSNSDGTLTITPTTGAVVASLALGNPNTWTATQTLNAALGFDASGAAQIKLPVAAGYTSAANGEAGFDSTSSNWHVWNGADKIAAPLAAGFVSGDCGQPTSSGGKWEIADLGGPCASASAVLPTGFLGQTLENLSGVTYIPTFSSVFYGTSGCIIAGDSWMQGGGVTWLSQSAENYVVRALGGVCTNYSVSGSMAPDEAINQVWNHVQPNYTRGQSTVIEAGVNDANTGGVNYESNYQFTLQGMIADAAIPYANKIWGSSSGCPVSGAGGASNFTAIPGVQGSQSTTNGTVWTCTTGGGTKVDVAWWAADSNGGVASLSIDGGAATDTLTASGFTTTILTGNGTSQTIFDKQYTVPAAGSHTVVVTVTSATNASNKFALIYAATPYLTTGIVTPPSVYVYGVPYENGDLKSATTAAYNSIASSVASIYANEGLPVQFINVRGFMNFTTDMQPTVSGLAGSFSVADGVSTTGAAATTITSATANFGPSMVRADCNAYATSTCWPINISGAGTAGGALDALIIGYISPTQVLINTPALTAGTGETLIYGPPGTVACGVNVAPLHANCAGQKHVADALNAVVRPGKTPLSNSPQFQGTIQELDVNQLYPAFYTSNVPSASAFQTSFATVLLGCPTGTPFAGSVNGTLLGINICSGTSPDAVGIETNGVTVFKIFRDGSTTSASDIAITPNTNMGFLYGGASGGTIGTTRAFQVWDSAVASPAWPANGCSLCVDVANTSNQYPIYAMDNNVIEFTVFRTGDVVANGTSTMKTSAILNGATSGSITISAPSVAGANTVTLPALTGILPLMPAAGGQLTTAGTAVSAGTCQAQTGLTVTGTTTTSGVLWSIPTALPATWQTGITVVPVVTSNTVTLNLCNPTAGSITPAAQAVNVRVIL